MANNSKSQSSPARREEKKRSTKKQQRRDPPTHSSTSHDYSPCAPQKNAALKCLEDIKKDKNKCQGYFDKYKECMKKEKDASLEQNRGRSLFS